MSNTIIKKAKNNSWGDRAYQFLCKFTKTRKRGELFLAEDVREAFTKVGHPAPHDNRAWGAVLRRAAREGVITQSDYAPSKTGHGRPMPQWAVVIG